MLADDPANLTPVPSAKTPGRGNKMRDEPCLEIEPGRRMARQKLIKPRSTRRKEGAEFSTTVPRMNTQASFGLPKMEDKQGRDL